MFHPIVEKRPHIFSFQETHILLESEQQISQSLYSDVYYASAPESSRGVLIGFRPGLNYKVVSSIPSSDGFYLLLNCLIEDKPITLVSVYFPPLLPVGVFGELLNEIQEGIISFGNPDTLWFGDFNAVLDPNIDANRVCSTAYTKPVAQFIENQELTIVWRGMYPEERRYTCFARNVSSLSQVVFF